MARAFDDPSSLGPWSPFYYTEALNNSDASKLSSEGARAVLQATPARNSHLTLPPPQDDIPSLSSRCISTITESSVASGEIGSDNSVKTLVNIFPSFTERLATAIVDGFIAESGYFRSCAYGQSRGPDADGTSATQTSAEKNNNGKRKLSNDDGGDDDEQGEERERPLASVKRSKPDKTMKSLFACPYAKFDPQRYSMANVDEEPHFARCQTATLTSIAFVKQHLKRTHEYPRYLCGVCYERFPADDSFVQHQLDRLCQRQEGHKNPYDEMMKGEQWDQINKKNRGMSETDKWFRIFRILFPRADLPTNPYRSTCHIQMMEAFITYIRVCGPDLCQQLWNTCYMESEQSTQVSNEVLAAIKEAFEVAFSRVHEAYERAGNGGSARGHSNAAEANAETDTEPFNTASSSSGQMTTTSLQTPAFAGSAPSHPQQSTSNHPNIVIEDHVDSFNVPYPGWDHAPNEPGHDEQSGGFYATGQDLIKEQLQRFFDQTIEMSHTDELEDGAHKM